MLLHDAASCKRFAELDSCKWALGLLRNGCNLKGRTAITVKCCSHLACAGRDGFVKDRWLEFVRLLDTAFVKHKSHELASLNLLLTTLLNFPAARLA